MSHVYHYTDTARLPWIIDSGVLRPSSNRIGGFPADFLWATSEPHIDRTSSSSDKEIRSNWRKGQLLLVRFVLDSSDFKNWELVARENSWTEKHISLLKQSALLLGEADTTKWLSRSDPLPLSNVLRIESRSFSSKNWKAVECRTCVTDQVLPTYRGIEIEGYVYGSIRQVKDGLAYYNLTYRR